MGVIENLIVNIVPLLKSKRHHVEVALLNGIDT